MARAGGKDRGIFERPAGSGVWWIRYHDARGRERREKAGTKRQARALYIQRKDEGRRGLAQEPEPDRLTVHDLLERYLPEVLMRWRAAKEPTRFAVLWSQEFGGVPVAALSPGHLQAWKARYLESHSPASANRALALLGRVFTLAMRDEMVSRNPVRATGRVREPAGRTRWLRPEEEERLRKVMAPGDWRLVEVAMQTGMRQSEQFGLRREHVHLEAGIILLPDSKSGRSRVVALSETARRLLVEAMGEHDLPWVFPGELRRGPLDAHNWMSRVWRRALERAGITDLRWHDLRHTYASRLAMAGVTTRTLQELLGHQTPSMTARYAHLAPDHLRSAVAILDVTGTGTGTSS